MSVITQKVHIWGLLKTYESICLIYLTPSYSKCLVYFKYIFPKTDTDTAGTKKH